MNGTPPTPSTAPYSGTRSLDQLKELVGGEQRRARALAEITDDLMSKGPADAPVTLELFADLRARSAGRQSDVWTSDPAVSLGVRLQFRNFPLAFHPQAPWLTRRP